jgi:hypothetical protein
MKKLFLVISLLLLTGFCLHIKAQSVERSSGVKKLNMMKSSPDKKENSTRSSEGSVRVSLPMNPRPTVILNGDGNGFTWIAPGYAGVRTSENIFEISATVNSEENIKYLNIYNNGQYIKNIVPPVSTIKQMVVEEPIELHLDRNDIKIEAVTVSGKKIVSSAEVIYDISSAKYVALIIAVEDYDHPDISDLDQPISDATRFSNLIQAEYNFDKENITIMENPSKAEIFGKLVQMRKEITPEDNLLIYYAGHGKWDAEMKIGYWLPSDASPGNPVNWLPNTDLTNYLNVLKSKHTLLIADACFSGGIFKSRSAFNNVKSVENMYKLTSRKAMTSGALKEVPDNSVFIEYLIKRLDSNQQKYLPSEKLYSSLKEVVENNSPNKPQYGTIQNVGDEGGDFIFIRRD